MPATFSVTFIDDSYLTNQTPLGQNIDVDFIAPFIEESQDIYIQDILGTDLYIYLCYKIFLDDTMGSLSVKERTLVELLSKSLSYWTVYMALPHIAIKMRNVGLARSSSDNTEKADLTDLRYIREEIKNSAEFWSERTVKYLCENSTDFPLYLTNNSNDINPSNSGYDSDYSTYNTDWSAAEETFLKKYFYR